MQITRTNVSSTEIKLLISATDTELTPIKDEVVKRLGRNIKVQGFRAGKAPQALIEKNIEPTLLQNDFLDEAMTQLYAHATRKEELRPVTRPEVLIKKFVPFTQLEFEVSTTIIGAIKLPDYTKLSVTKKPVEVVAKDVNDILGSLKTRMAEKNEVTRAAKDSDEAVIDFKGVDAKGEPIEGAEGSNYPLNLGSGAFIPGFEDNVLGMKSGEEKTFELTFPKDYNAKDLAGKKVSFTVTLQSVNELIEPKADDAFAAKVGPFKTLTELKADIKKQLIAEKEREAHAHYQDEVLRTLSDKSVVEMPAALIEQQVTFNLDDIRRNVISRGQTYEEYLKAEGKTEEELKVDLKPNAEAQLKASLILSEIADRDTITIEPEELDIHIQSLKGQYNDPAMQAELDKPENRRDIASRMLSEKVINHVITNLKK